MTRREMLWNTGGAAAAFAVPTIVPSTVFGAKAPSNRITLGVIGTGRKATGGMRNFMKHTDAKVVAICDVNEANMMRAAKTAGLTKENCHVDFRELLAREDVDAVLIGTPDHWHVLQAKAAVKAGKDVYCEKPLSNTIVEGQALVKAVRKHNRIFQHGTQLRSKGGSQHAVELVRNGYIGEVREVTIGSPPGLSTGDHPEEPVPDGFHYNLWLGPASKKHYTRWRCMRVPEIRNLAGWYFISDYSLAGWVAGYGVHDIDLAQWGLKTEHTGPVEVEGEGTFPESGLFDTVLDYHLEFKYADGRKITMTDTGQNRHGVVFHGEKQWVWTRGRAAASEVKLMNVKMKDSDERVYKSDQHERDFIECCKSRKDPITPIEVAHRSTSICLIGGICLKLGRKLKWDPGKERFLDDDEANAMLSYEMRAPWKLD
jgi:predicted dehydrogenase